MNTLNENTSPEDQITEDQTSEDQTSDVQDGEPAGSPEPDYLSMSDEDIAKMNGPAGSEPLEGGQDTSEEGETGEDTEGTDEDAENAGTGDHPGEGESAQSDGEEEPSRGAQGDPDGTPENSQGGNAGVADQTGSKDEKKDEKNNTSEVLNAEAELAKILAPFKANGRQIQVQNADEAVRLMQMGANYNKKMQGLKPVLKIARMLEQHNLMDEAKLSRLIDLDRKDPAAIRQLVKDAGIDPMDMDTSQETGYKPRNYGVSDQEVAFVEAMDEVKSTPDGQKLITLMHKTWDKESQRALWDDPSLFRVMAQHKEAGFYDQISHEIERKKIMGEIPASTPFIQAYEIVGQELDQRGALVKKTGLTSDQTTSQTAPSQTQGSPVPQSQPQQPIGTSRSSQPQKTRTAANHDRAKAAAPVKSAPPKKASMGINPLAMSDEEFEKHAALGRML